MSQFNDYLRLQLKDLPGLAAWWPLDDTVSTQSYSRVVNPGVSTGRNIVPDGASLVSGNWTLNAGWTISGGQLVATSAAANTAATEPISIVVGKAYALTYTISGYGGGSVIPSVTDGNNGAARNANGTYTDVIVVGFGGGNNLAFKATVSAFTGTISNIIITQVNVPAYNSVPAQLLTDGNMEAAGTSAWTAGNSATLSKQTGTPHSGSQVLRVARNAVAKPYAGQTVLASRNVYRVYGYVRSDGSATPVIYSNGTTTTLFTGTTSTTWQPFDFIFVAGATDINFGTSTNTGTQYVEFDDVTVFLDNAIRPDNILSTLDGDMEQSGTSYWSAFNGAVLTKQTTSPHGGTQVLRVAIGGANGSPDADQNILVGGKTYRVTGWARSDGNAIPKILDGGGTAKWTGTTSTSWQQVDTTFIEAITLGSVIFLNTSGSPNSGQYTEWDDMSVTEVDPLSGIPTNGVLLGKPANGHLAYAYSFDGTNDCVNIYSTDLNSVFNPSEGTLVAWARVSGAGVWTDATIRRIIALTVDANNKISIYRTATNNQLQFDYIANGITKSVINASLGGRTNVNLLAITWSVSNGEVKAFINGLQVGSTQTSLGTWAGNLASTTAAIGASGSSGTNPWSGFINDVRLYSRALSAYEIRQLYNPSSWLFYVNA